jgi:hypothetical protein
MIHAIAARLSLPDDLVITAYEDVPKLLRDESALPVDADPLRADMSKPSDRARLAKLLAAGLEKPAGFVLPLRPAANESKAESGSVWESSTWPLRRERLYAIAGDSPLGLRLPLSSLPERVDEFDPPVDPFAPTGELPRRETLGRAHGKPRGAANNEVIKTALTVEARKGRWGVLGDAMYVEFSDAFDRALNSEVEVSGGVFDMVGSMAASNGRPLDLLFGLRYVALKATVDIAPVARATARESWLDPLVGLRYTHVFNERWSVALRGDIGGFGVASDLATNVSAMFGWHINDKLTLRGGYRMLQMDFDGDDLVLDATLQGYVFGASWAF